MYIIFYTNMISVGFIIKIVAFLSILSVCVVYLQKQQQSPHSRSGHDVLLMSSRFNSVCNFYCVRKKNHVCYDLNKTLLITFYLHRSFLVIIFRYIFIF